MFRRGTKVLFAIVLLGFGGWTLLQSYSSSLGEDAIVRAEMATVRAPYDGYVHFAQLQRGARLRRGQLLGTLELVPAMAQGSNGTMLLLRTEGRATAIRAEIATLQAQIRGLRQRTDEYREARLTELHTKLAEAAAQISAARAKEQSARTILEREQQLYATGNARLDAVLAAQKDADAAQLQRRAASERAARLRVGLTAARRGVFLIDGYNDSLYSQQHADQLALKVTDLQAELQQQEGLLAALTHGGIDRQAAIDRQASRSLRLYSPVSGILWRIASDGGYEPAGQPLASVADCSRLFSDVAIGPREYERLQRRQRAVFQEQDRNRKWGGTVIWTGVPGSDTSPTVDAALGASATKARFSAVVAFDDTAQSRRWCPVGKPGRIRFAGSAGAINGLADLMQNLQRRAVRAARDDFAAIVHWAHELTRRVSQG